ncbi:MAG TPA: hypothetical protein VFO79_13260 [Xanthomonadales bacterium]|nr:hypothetical protein [Xanthomonadales bacterium]
MTQRSVYASCLLVLAGACLPLVARASEPVAVSPGDAGRTDVVGSACPTFNWGFEGKAERFELAVYLAGSADTDPVFVQSLPGSARGWTPPLAQCLSPGTRYAWRVRAVSDAVASAWSTSSFFGVAPYSQSMQLEQAMAVINEVLAAQRGDAGAAGAARTMPAPGAAMPKGATAQLEVAGGVTGASFTGDGSGLTNVDAATLDGVNGTGYTASNQTCAAGQYVRGIDATGNVICAALADYVNASCQLYFGSRDSCSGCTTAPAKWGRVSGVACTNGAGANNTCQASSLGGETITLFGLNPDELDANDKLYIGLKCQ